MCVASHDCLDFDGDLQIMMQLQDFFMRDRTILGFFLLSREVHKQIHLVGEHSC